MSQDPRGRRLSKPEKEAILADIWQRSASLQSLATKHRVSISTVSRLAAEHGLSAPRKKSKPVSAAPHSYDKARRTDVLDRMLYSIDSTVAARGAFNQADF
jgi:transposase-like protein